MGIQVYGPGHVINCHTWTIQFDPTDAQVLGCRLVPSGAARFVGTIPVTYWHTVGQQVSFTLCSLSGTALQSVQVVCSCTACAASIIHNNRDHESVSPECKGTSSLQ
jgi:hypothetical protein